MTIYPKILKYAQISSIIGLRILNLHLLLLLFSPFLLKIWTELFKMFYLAMHSLHVNPIQDSFMIFRDKIGHATNTTTLIGLSFFPVARYFSFGICPGFSFYSNSML